MRPALEYVGQNLAKMTMIDRSPQPSWSEPLTAFVRECDEDSTFALRVRACEGPRALADLLQVEGFELDLAELRHAARELKAPYFPWNGSSGDGQFRRAWFARDA